MRYFRQASLHNVAANLLKRRFRLLSKSNNMARITDLPAELRNWIYELVLPEGKHYDLRWPRRTPALCRTNQLFRMECLPI